MNSKLLAMKDEYTQLARKNLTGLNPEYSIFPMLASNLRLFVSVRIMSAFTPDSVNERISCILSTECALAEETPGHVDGEVTPVFCSINDPEYEWDDSEATLDDYHGLIREVFKDVIFSMVANLDVGDKLPFNEHWMGSLDPDFATSANFNKVFTSNDGWVLFRRDQSGDVEYIVIPNPKAELEANQWMSDKAMSVVRQYQKEILMFKL